MKKHIRNHIENYLQLTTKKEKGRKPTILLFPASYLAPILKKRMEVIKIEKYKILRLRCLKEQLLSNYE